MKPTGPRHVYSRQPQRAGAKTPRAKENFLFHKSNNEIIFYGIPLEFPDFSNLSKALHHFKPHEVMQHIT
jgi:hypothetical protein